MKKIFLFLVVAVLVNKTQSQVSKLIYKDGMKINLAINSYANSLLSDQKFLKSDQEKKDQQIAAYNETVVSGKIQPGKYEMVYTVTKEQSSTPEIDNYKSATTINGVEYPSYITATKDTMYVFRRKGINSSVVNGETIGFVIQGAQKIPFNLKIGDKLPTYEDVGVLYSKETTQNVREQVFSRMQTTTTQDVGVGISTSGNVINGIHYKTSTSAVYNTIETEVRKKLTTSMYIIYYVNATVTRNEEISVGGKKFNAFIIESETWSRSVNNTTYESDRASASQLLASQEAKMQEKMAKKMVKWGFNNEQGYMVSYREEWFVPEVGVVKVRSFDTFGGIVNEIVVDSMTD